MTQVVGTTYLSTIATLSDDASVVDAFRYYHTGGLTGSTFPNSIEQRLIDANTRSAVLETNVGYTGISPVPATVQNRLVSLESSVGSGLSSTYLKMIPSSNDNNTTRNLVSPATSGVVPMVIQGVVGQTANLQEWKTNAATVAKVDNAGRLYSYDGTAMTEVTTLTGNQTLTNKTLINPISTIATNARTASYVLTLSDQSKVIEINSASATTLTIPGDANVNFPIGTYIVILQTGAGQITVDTMISVDWFITLNSTPGKKLRAQWSMASLIKRGVNSWVLSGDTVA